MSHIAKPKVYHVYLGEGHEFFDKCINENIFMLDYRTVPDDICRNGDWDAVRNFFLLHEKKTAAVSTFQRNILRFYYESTSADVWITHRNGQFWWCQAKPEITILDKNIRSRKVLGKWSNVDVDGNPLNIHEITPEFVEDHKYRLAIHLYPEDEANYWRKILLKQ